MDDPLLGQVLDALSRSVDKAKLREAFGVVSAAAPAPAPAASHGEERTDDVLGKLVLADILDASILGARPGEKSFPLRILLSKVSESLASDTAFTFACGLGFYFRSTMDEETRMRLGIEVSRAFYLFAGEAKLSRAEASAVAPLLATLMSGELERLRLESVDHLAVFDSQIHERVLDADATSSEVAAVCSFACRVGKTNVVRAKALVRT